MSLDNWRNYNNGKYILTKDGNIIKVDPELMYATKPAQYIDLVSGAGILTTEVEYIAETKEQIIQYLQNKKEKERIKILLTSSSKLAELNIIDLLIVTIDGLLEQEIKVDDYTARKLDGREIFHCLSETLKLYKEKLKEEEK